jgi:NitT/TauT family transport system ATP-binding protein
MSNIVFDSVSRTFRRNRREQLAVDDVSLEVREREFVALVGPSGCGKTTCLRMAAGLDFPTAGTVTVGGKKVEEPGPQRAVVFQQFALFPWKTVYDNIDFGLRSQGVPAVERRARIAAQLELMGLQGYESAYPHELSGGMQQRVGLARALAIDPRVMLMDEPFAALDAQTRETMQAELLRIQNREKKTMIFVTHSIDEAVYLADRVIVFTRRPSRILEIVDVPLPHPRWEDPEEFRARPEFVRLRLHIARLLKGAYDHQ